ncbi:MAG: hypothetical protein M3416_04305 [Acidobacteriota bacterium]|nr:hypothetical protein [Acidobacteriota bacterium]
MAKVIEIAIGRDRNEGTITFEENPRQLHADRTADGFKLSIPVKIGFYTVTESAPRPMLSNLRGTVLADGSNSPKFEIGRIYSEDWFTAYSRGQDEPETIREREASLTWQGSLAELVLFEKIREGNAPQLEISLRGEFCYLLQGAHRFYGVRTEPQRFYSRSGNSARVSYPREVWNKMLQSLGVAENVLVEVPLPGNPSGDWDPVWRALIDARNYFEQGGSTGWKGCVTSVRLALEKWRGVEVEDPGPGFVRPSQADREARTKKQRLDQLRWDLLQMAHQGPHTHTEMWTRDDALLMLATLSALLAERSP